MTKIILEESITSTIKTGVGQHTIMLTNLIKEIGNNYEVVSNKLVEKIKNATLKRIVYLVWLNTIFFFKLLLEKEKTIVIYTSFLPVIKLKKIIQIGIIHDLCVDIYPEKLSYLNKINQRILNMLIIKNADRILTVSNTVNTEVQKFYNVPQNKIYTVYNSFSLNMNPEVDADEILQKYSLSKSDKYFISSSSLNPNKNIKSLIEAFNILNEKYPNYKLILTGGKHDVIKHYLNLSNNPNIIFTGFVSNNELAALYENAQCYVFPSIYEGFGIPIIDAQLIGVPVICSDIPVFHEIGEKSVIYSPTSAEGYANALCVLLQNKDRISSLVEKGYKNCQRFSKECILKQLKILLEGK